MKPERLLLYILSGIVSALISWDIAQIMLGLARSISGGTLPFRPDFILLPVLAFFFAITMVATEIFLSNPTRYRNNFQTLRSYFLKTILSAALSGLFAAISTFILYEMTRLSAQDVKIIAWSIVGLCTGLCEGLSWRSRSTQGLTAKGTKRIYNTIVFGSMTGFAAAILTEQLSQNKVFPSTYNEPISFFIFGCILGAFLSIATSPTFQVALRAGEGLESINPERLKEDTVKRERPKLKQTNTLQFVIEPPNEGLNSKEADVIEEGLSIQLPIGKPITIGGDKDNDDIYLPGIFKTLREYEVTYKQKDAKQATEYKTILTVTSQERNFKFSSPEKLIRLNNFGFQAALSWQEYLVVLAITSFFAITWFFIFLRWSSQLRNQLEKVSKQ